MHLAEKVVWLRKKHKLSKQKCNRSVRSRVRDVQPISCLCAHGFALSRANMSIITRTHVHAQWKKTLISCLRTRSAIKNANPMSGSLVSPPSGSSRPRIMMHGTKGVRGLRRPPAPPNRLIPSLNRKNDATSTQKVTEVNLETCKSHADRSTGSRPISILYSRKFAWVGN